MFAGEFRRYIIRPALKNAGLWCPSSENLLLGTALVESDLNRLKQVGGGPALSFFQIEKNTYYDVVRYLSAKRNADLKQIILKLCHYQIFPPSEVLVCDMRFACLIARVRYWMEPEKLPEKDALLDLANYWLKYYNRGGKGKISDYVDAWEARIEDE